MARQLQLLARYFQRAHLRTIAESIILPDDEWDRDEGARTFALDCRKRWRQAWLIRLFPAPGEVALEKWKGNDLPAGCCDAIAPRRDLILESMIQSRAAGLGDDRIAQNTAILRRLLAVGAEVLQWG